MEPTEKKHIPIADIFNFINFAKVGGTIVIAFAVVWLNNNYVKRDEFRALEARVQIVDSRSANTEKQLNDIIPVLKNIDRRLSSLITEDGKILYDNKIVNMEKDISLIQRDIEYIKDSIKKPQ